MTNAETIRQMTDEELAVLFDEAISKRDRWWVERLRECNVDIKFTEAPAINRLRMLEVLQMEAET